MHFKNCSKNAFYIPLYTVFSICLLSAPQAHASDDLSPLKLEPASSKRILLAQSEDGGAPQIPSQIATPQSVKSANLTGIVKDLSGELLIQNAFVVIHQLGVEHPKRFETETDANGLYKFNNLPPGKWQITTSAKEMMSHTTNVDLVAGQTSNIDMKLEDLEPTDVIRITGKRTLIHPEQIGSTTNIDKTIITQYKSGNDLRKLIESTPGMMTDTLGNIVTRGEHNAVNYELDGVILPEAAGVLQQSQFVTPRSLKSMQVDIGGYQASDGGGPLGAVVRMKSLPVSPVPSINVGGQIGSPIAGNIYYSGSSALSQDPDSPLYKLRIESSGQFSGTSLGLAPPTMGIAHNGRMNINTLTKLEWVPTDYDTVKFTVGINQSFINVPTSKSSYRAGVRMNQSDMQNFAILSWNHRYRKFFDQSNLHLINSFYYENFRSRNVFDPTPVLNGEQPLLAIAPNAYRFNYVFGAQGDISKTVINTHHLKAGFLSEVRPVRTNFSSSYYNVDPTNGFAYGAAMSPFTGTPIVTVTEPDPDDPDAQATTTVNPYFSKQMGMYKGFRWLQSAYLQDSWRPTTGILKRLTADAGVRFDLYHGVFGSTGQLAQALATIPDAPAFSLRPFGTQRITNAQASGRFGLAYVLTPTTVMRGSFSQIFQPPPVDLFVTPPNIEEIQNGIFAGTPRPLQATRGYLVDTSIEQQIGPRFAMRANLFYKNLKNSGDSGVVGNAPLYNRLQLSGQEVSGVETRMDLKPKRDGTGFYGFFSGTVALANINRGRTITGGVYDYEALPKHPDHDKRFQMTSAVGYRHKLGWWVMPEVQVATGFQDLRDVALVGPHPRLSPTLAILGLNAGYTIPTAIRDKYKFLPNSCDMRVENLLNNRFPVNLGSPFSGTRYLNPFRVLFGCYWEIGKSKLGS
jgi:hypothetical protein